MTQSRSRLFRASLLALAALILPLSTGCFGTISKIGSELVQDSDPRNGVTFYVGGAGPIGHVGSFDIPLGLQDAGYDGYVKVFPWQGLTHAGDQINLSKNREKASELAHEIRTFARDYPGRKINVIALSAGTGIATFALEYLPERLQVQNVIFLGCSLSSNYDFTRALRRVRGGLYCVYSPSDIILKDIVWYTGTVDRSNSSDGIAGLEGFHRPATGSSDAPRQYAKVHNVAYRPEFAGVGYRGGHTDSTARGFVSTYLAGIILGTENTLVVGDGTVPRHVSQSSPARPKRGAAEPTEKESDVSVGSRPKTKSRTVGEPMQPEQIDDAAGGTSRSKARSKPHTADSNEPAEVGSTESDGARDSVRPHPARESAQPSSSAKKKSPAPTSQNHKAAPRRGLAKVTSATSRPAGATSAPAETDSTDNTDWAPPGDHPLHERSPDAATTRPTPTE